MKRLILCALLTMALPASAQFGNIDLGKALDFGKKVVKAGEASRDLSPEEEVALGEGITSGILGASPLHPDANLQRYVNRVGKWLALHTEVRGRVVFERQCGSFPPRDVGVSPTASRESRARSCGLPAIRDPSDHAML